MPPPNSGVIDLCVELGFFVHSRQRTRFLAALGWWYWEPDIKIPADVADAMRILAKTDFERLLAYAQEFGATVKKAPISTAG